MVAMANADMSMPVARPRLSGGNTSPMMASRHVEASPPKLGALLAALEAALS